MTSSRISNEVILPTLASLASSLRQSSGIPLELIDEQLHVGVEATFQTEKLVGIVPDWVRPHCKNFELRLDNIQNVKPSEISRFLEKFLPTDCSIIRELPRFIHDVLRPINGKLVWNPTVSDSDDLRKSGQLVLPDAQPWFHRSGLNNARFPLCFLGQLPEGHWCSVHIDPNCFEVNMRPLKIRQLSSWSALYERASSAGFFGSVDSPAGGGGCHLHFSFGQDGLKPVIERPLLLFALLTFTSFNELPKLYLSEIGNQGKLSAKKTLSDWLSDSPNLSDELDNISKFFKTLELHQTANPAPKILKNHNSALNLKNYPDSAELRIFRAFQTYSDLCSAVGFLRKLLSADPARLLYVAEHFPLHLRRRKFRDWMTSVGFEKVERKKLMNFSGVNIEKEGRKSIRIKTRVVRANLLPLCVGEIPKIIVDFPSPPNGTRCIIYIGGKRCSASYLAKEKRSSIVVQCGRKHSVKVKILEKINPRSRTYLSFRVSVNNQCSVGLIRSGKRRGG